MYDLIKLHPQAFKTVPTEAPRGRNKAAYYSKIEFELQGTTLHELIVPTRIFHDVKYLDRGNHHQMC